MQTRKTDQGYIITVDKGEEVMKTLTEFCTREGITAASFSGIGAAARATFGYYDLGTKEYVFETKREPLEVAPMTGNVALVDGEPFLHVHTIFTDTSNRAFGGHVKEMTVGVTLEVFLTPHETKVERKLNEEIGLKLLNL